MNELYYLERRRKNRQECEAPMNSPVCVCACVGARAKLNKMNHSQQ